MCKNKRALVLGATGLVGNALLTALLEDDRYQQVQCLLRAPEKLQRQAEQYPQKLVLMQTDLSDLGRHAEAFSAAHIYICLGTTIKQAGSQAAFRAVDFDAVLLAAELAKAEGNQSLVWISSVDANPNSSSFYLRVKGELEQAIKQLGLPHAVPVQPSLLLGERQDPRPLERLGVVLLGPLRGLFIGPLARYRPIYAQEVAQQMIAQQDFGV